MRTPVSADAERVAVLLHQLGHPENDVAAVQARLGEWAADPTAAVLVAERDGCVVGVVGVATLPYLERDGRWGRVVAIVTDAEHRGQGIGQALMRAAEQVARAFGCVRMEVTSANRRVDAHAFYRGLGYSDWADRSGRFLKDLVPGLSAAVAQRDDAEGNRDRPRDP